MKILVTGAAGFTGSTLIETLRESVGDAEALEIIAFDNFSRPGSERNRARLAELGASLVHGDLRLPSDLEVLPAVDWVIDAAANPSVLAGVDGRTSSRQLLEHNLVGTINLLEYRRASRAGFILLSTSRVYSIEALAGLEVTVTDGAYRLDPEAALPAGLTELGIREDFSTAPPISLYGSSKLAAEALALEYGQAFDFEVWINRCGNLAGAGQFGRPDQGIFAFWIHSFREQAPLKYIGFDGQGHQVRDCIHPRDLVPLMLRQMETAGASLQRVQNIAGGQANAISLAQLSDWCAERFAPMKIASDATPRPFDLPWVVLDSSRAREQFDWQPLTPMTAILEEIAGHAESNADWLALSR